MWTQLNNICDKEGICAECEKGLSGNNCEESCEAGCNLTVSNCDRYTKECEVCV